MRTSLQRYALTCQDTVAKPSLSSTRYSVNKQVYNCHTQGAPYSVNSCTIVTLKVRHTLSTIVRPSHSRYAIQCQQLYNRHTQGTPYLPCQQLCNRHTQGTPYPANSCTTVTFKVRHTLPTVIQPSHSRQAIPYRQLYNRRTQGVPYPVNSRTTVTLKVRHTLSTIVQPSQSR